MKKRVIKQIALLVAVLTLLSTVGCGRKEHHRRGHRQGPPPEAIAACQDKQAGDSVEFSGRNGETVKAACREINGQLAAVPAGMSRERHD
ncbi:MAG: hypothetical protein [Olavius algarvensis Delta 4 endosymbiont]|nr:MAG: hypothetical protein [Olavius algarvensis Delta 4 endosymbiont]